MDSLEIGRNPRNTRNALPIFLFARLPMGVPSLPLEVALAVFLAFLEFLTAGPP
jgi:hypothetical protein